jgi:hypothetical protein
MQIIVHKIRLLDVKHAAAFEDWVLNTDYATCPQLPSVRQFSVQRVSDSPTAAFHYFEVITITSPAEFERDMDTPAFVSLVERFTTMAEVIEETAGTRLGDGYRAG